MGSDHRPLGGFGAPGTLHFRLPRDGSFTGLSYTHDQGLSDMRKAVLSSVVRVVLNLKPCSA